MGTAKSKQNTDHTRPRPASFIPSQGPAIGLPSPLGSVMSSQQTASRRKKDMNTPLLLTALVDAFSILVIFLLVQIAGVPNEYEANDKLMLPKASAVSDISNDKTAVITNLVFVDGGFKLDGQTVTMATLKNQLVRIKAEKGASVRLIIQADQRSDFDRIAPILAITAEAGIANLEFAVESVAADVASNSSGASGVSK